MNIGFFTDSYFPGIGGVTHTIQAWRDRLEDRGHDVYVVSPESSHEPDSQVRRDVDPYRLLVGTKMDRDSVPARTRA